MNLLISLETSSNNCSVRLRQRERETDIGKGVGEEMRKKSKVPNLLDLICNHSIDIEIFIRSCRVAHGPRSPWIVNRRDKKVPGEGWGGGIFGNSKGFCRISLGFLMNA